LIAELPAPPPDERNAAVQALKVNELVTGTKYVVSARTFHRYCNARLSNQQKATLTKSLGNATAEVLAEARKLKDMPAGRFSVEHEEDTDTSNQAPLLSLLNVMKLIHIDVVLRGNDRDIEGAANSCLAQFHVLRSVGGFPGLMPQLVRCSGQHFAVVSVERTLGQGELSGKQLQTLQDALVKEAEHNLLYAALRGERAYVHEGYLMMRDGKRPIAAYFGLPTGIHAHLVRFFPNMALSGYADHLRLTNEEVRASKLSGEAQAEAFRNLDAKIQKLGFSSSLNFHHSIRKEYPQLQARLRCAIVAVAAERYRVEHKSWPSGISELVKAGLLKEILDDPYDGQPLRWKRTADYLVVYSVGEKKIDDGGKLDAFNARPDGLGFVLWMPHLRHVPPPEVEENPKKKKK
jgi:hypothetical protein